MTRESRREALLTRFRVAALDRLAGLRGRLRAPLPADELAAIKAGLHTLKGESRMLGLASFASLVHAIEDWLAEHPTLEDAAAIEPLELVLGLLAERLAAPLVEDDAARDALAQGLAILRGEAPTRAPTTNPSPTLARSGLALVDGATVDQVCERLEQVRASLGALEAGARQRGERSVALTELEPLRRECAELGELAWSLRMVAVEPALHELANHAEQLAARLGKQVCVEVDAGGAELERSLLERLHEPLLHLVHNAIDHGLEPARERGDKPARGRLHIVARSQGRELELAVEDDGRGLDHAGIRARAVERGLVDARAAELLGDEELLGLIFTTGFSTTARVGELSGRGVGLDVVRRVVEGLGGSIGVTGERARGARFTLRVPATISRERVLVVALAGGLWGLPARRVERIVALPDTEGPSLRFEGEHLPLLSMERLLGVGSEPERVALICSRGARRYAIACPPLLGEHELFRRPLGPTLASLGLASASAILDDGRLVLLVEPGALIDVRHRAAAPRLASPPEPDISKPGPSPGKRPRVLVVDDSAIVRELLVELLRASGLEVEAVEDGLAALELLARARVDLVVSDLEMPRVDGFELVARIRERHGNLPVIVSSTRAAPADRQRALELGANAYLIKTASSSSSLLDAVARFVEVQR